MDVETNIVSIAELDFNNQKNKYNCQNPVIAKRIRDFLLLPSVDFRNTTNLFLKPLTIHSNLSYVTIFDVDSYIVSKSLDVVGDKLENDHIPAKASIRDYFKTKTILTKTEISNLYNNLSSLTVTDFMHKFGRTWGNKNNVARILEDSKDLKKATIKDLTNHYLYVL